MFDSSRLVWKPQPLPGVVADNRIEMTTCPGTDLWQKTFSHGGCDNAPVLQMAGQRGRPCPQQ